jgi:hypothetical protein
MRVLCLLAIFAAGCVNPLKLARQWSDFSQWETGTSEQGQGAQGDLPQHVPGMALIPPAATPPPALQAAATLPDIDPRRDPEPQPQLPQLVVRAEDPATPFYPAVHLTILQFQVPLGAVGDDAEFWKPLDETIPDVATRAHLDRNGIRAGLALPSDVPRLLAALADKGAQAEPPRFSPAGTQAFHVPLKSGVPYQIIYYLAPDGQMPIRSFDDSHNLFYIAFGPARRLPGGLTVALCPVVRSQRTILRPLDKIEVGEFRITADQSYYEMNLRADIPGDGALVVAPSPAGRSPMSIGSAFLVADGPNGQYETILLLVARPNLPPTSARAGGEK